MALSAAGSEERGAQEGSPGETLAQSLAPQGSKCCVCKRKKLAYKVYSDSKINTYSFIFFQAFT